MTPYWLIWFMNTSYFNTQWRLFSFYVVHIIHDNTLYNLASCNILFSIYIYDNNIYNLTLAIDIFNIISILYNMQLAIFFCIRRIIDPKLTYTKTHFAYIRIYFIFYRHSTYYNIWLSSLPRAEGGVVFTETKISLKLDNLKKK